MNLSSVFEAKFIKAQSGCERRNANANAINLFETIPTTTFSSCSGWLLSAGGADDSGMLHLRQGGADASELL